MECLISKCLKIKQMDNYKFYLVKSNGYKQQFTSYEVAKKDFEKMKNKMIKAEETFKINLMGRNTPKDDWEELDSVQITDTYYA